MHAIQQPPDIVAAARAAAAAQAIHAGKAPESDIRVDLFLRAGMWVVADPCCEAEFSTFGEALAHQRLLQQILAANCRADARRAA